MSARDFMGKPAPPNYIAGLGRGATGFTTRSDLGPARMDATATPAAMPFVATGANAAAMAASLAAEAMKFAKNEEGLLGSSSGGVYDAEDAEADRIYASIDAKMQRRKLNPTSEKKESDTTLGSVHEQFSDLKRNLAQMSQEDWESLPEAGDMRAVGRKMRKEREKSREMLTFAPDTFIASARDSSQLASSLDTSDSIISGDSTDFRSISKARDNLLRVRLDQAGTTTSTKDINGSVDAKGYLTDLGSIALKTDTEIGDIKKARELLNSVIMTNPEHAPGWIAAARLEEIDGKIGQARILISRGCQECTSSEDIWLEASRLHTPDSAKMILANAVQHVAHSAKIWLAAAELEKDDKAKKRVLRKGLEYIPNSVQLWKSAIELEEDMEDARILLSRAVECVPLSVELWLALARLETFENAQKVLNKARAACPNSYEIWIAAAKLADTAGEVKKVENVINGAVRALCKIGANLTREQWLQEAEKCEKAGRLIACQAIVLCTIGQDVDDDDCEEVWMDDAEACALSGSIETARAIYVHALSKFVYNESIWQNAAFFERDHGTRESLQELLKRAVEHCPESETLWLMSAKEQWVSGDIDGARAILENAFKANANSEKIWLAAVKLETENGQYDKGRLLLKKAREEASSPKVWLKSIVLERNLNNRQVAMELLNEALRRHETFDKFWLIKGQMVADNYTEAAATYALALKKCPKSVPLWIESARLEIKCDKLTRARAILDKARLVNPKSAALWMETIKVEQLANNHAQSKALMSKALQECPASGELWSVAIFMEPRQSRKSKSVDALKKCENDAVLVATVARLFWHERNVDKARSWFNRALKLSTDNGDTWAWLYKFGLEYGGGGDTDVADVVKRCAAADPHHGAVWPTIAKDPLNWRKSPAEILELVAKKLNF